MLQLYQYGILATLMKRIQKKGHFPTVSDLRTNKWNPMWDRLGEYHAMKKHVSQKHSLLTLHVQFVQSDYQIVGNKVKSYYM